MSSLELLSVTEVKELLECWDMSDFVEWVKEKQITGKKLCELSEGDVNLWPNVDADKFISFVQNVRTDPLKYLKYLKNDDVITIKETYLHSDSQYQTVSVRKISSQESTSSLNTVEEILKKITPPKSFLYRNQQKKQDRALTSYVPMGGGSGSIKKPRFFFRLSSYEHPFFDLKSRFLKVDNSNDRGYYSVKTENKFYIQKNYIAESRSSRKFYNASEELNGKVQEDHFYEDLCYNEVNPKEMTSTQNQGHQARPCIVKIQELFQSLRLPFFRKAVETKEKEQPIYKDVAIEGNCNIYENSLTDMYDSVHVQRDIDDNEKGKQKPELAVEDYLEPVQVNKDYCDVCLTRKDDSLLGYIMNYLETRLGMKRETNEVTQSEELETKPSCDRVWESNMAARPLPVPLENEPFYMNIERNEAESMLTGQPDGTFILRPSSQSNHAYTLSVSCGKSVHNVGVRRRPDGRLALGFPRRGERSFQSVSSLLRYHKKHRLLLVAGGDVIGATTLNESAQYYQTPSNIPVMR